MPRKLTPEQKKAHVVKQTLTTKQIERLENYPDARPISPDELNATIAASRPKGKQTA